MRWKVAQFDQSQENAQKGPKRHIEHENALFPWSWDPAHDFVILLARRIDAVPPNAGSLKKLSTV